MIATLLAVAALVCLGVGLRLMAASSAATGWTDNGSETRYVGALAIIGGLVVFLLGSIALLAARRFAVSTGRPSPTELGDLNLVDVQQWSHDLEIIRDDMRREVAIVGPEPQIQYQELEIPASWRPEGQYVLTSTGKSADPLADLKQTRDQLLAAAERVDDIVQSINETTANCSHQESSTAKSSPWRRWRNRLRF